MNAYEKKRFLEARPEQRALLCVKLAATLNEALAATSDFRGEVRRSIELLRRAGHDLWSMDEGDDFEVWGPNYQTPTGPGLILTFAVHDGVAVEWSEHG